ncbi:MAG: hypothetical protein RI984_263 [Pseudomonadota bacterium]|jgi:hypothetical protein
MSTSTSSASQRNSYPSQSASQEKSDVSFHSTVSVKNKSQINEENSARNNDESVELTSTIKTPRLKTKTPQAQNSRELFNKSSTPERSVDQSGSRYASKASNESEESEIIKVNPVPVAESSSEPRLVARTNRFVLTASAVAGLSMPFIMMLGPNDLASRAAWVGVAVASGLVLGAAYCFGDYVSELHDQVQSQIKSEISPA